MKDDNSFQKDMLPEKTQFAINTSFPSITFAQSIIGKPDWAFLNFWATKSSKFLNETKNGSQLAKSAVRKLSWCD